MPHADSEQVVRITGMGTKADYYYPTNWQAMDESDADFGSVKPVVVNVPGATPSSVVVAIAKDGGVRPERRVAARQHDQHRRGRP